MQNTKLSAGQTFPDIELLSPDGSKVNLLAAAHSEKTSYPWTMVVIYRGTHCPICLKYLNAITEFKDRLKSLNIDLIAASADTAKQLDAMKEKGLEVNFPILTELAISDMKTLGLYLSDPMDESETDHVFPEPALFIVNEEGKVVMIDIANAPFIRPDLEQLVSGLEFALEKNYPIRGTHTA